MDWVQKNISEFPFDIDFAVEDTPLGTGGGIRLAMQKVVPTFRLPEEINNHAQDSDEMKMIQTV